MAIADRLGSTTVMQMMVRALYPYGAIRTVRRGALRGSRLVVSPSMGLSTIWSLDSHAWSWVDRIHPGACVYDVGANFGQSTLRIARAVGPSGRVIAFEPLPATFAILQRNLDLNGLNQVTPVNAAVAAETGTDKLEINPSLPDQGSLANRHSDVRGRLIDVRCVALDDWRANGWPPPDFIKIDVEGGGAIVLRGAANLLASHRPPIYFELHLQPEYDAAALLQERHGYVLHDMSGRQIESARTAHHTVALLCHHPFRGSATG